MSAVPDPREALDNPPPAPEFARAGDIGPEIDGRDEYPAFPPDCPIRPLGITSDIGGRQTCFYLNWNGQIVGKEAGNQHGKLALAALFGPQIGWLLAQWPQFSKPVREQIDGKWEVVVESKIIGFDQAKAAEALIIECVRRGIFDPFGRLRGRGAHPIGNGGLLLHCGDKLMVPVFNLNGSIKRYQWIDAGLHERFVYTASEAIPRPHHDAADATPAIRLLSLLRTWQWKRPLLDPRFVLGAIGASLVGGALHWRPHIWITGGSGTGKSTLNGRDGVIHKIFGEGLFRTANTTAAGIRSALKNSTVPVMLDELEAKEDNRMADAVMELMRISSSGDKITRGSADHSGAEFTLQSCFWASSINIPPLEPQDRTRLAVCELDPLSKDALPPELGKYNFPEMGRLLLRRMIDGWHLLEATKLKYHAALALSGHTARGCDQFGTLLACADMLINDFDTHDGLPDDEHTAQWVERCRPDRMAEVAENTPDHERCVHHIVTSLQQSRGGDEREPIGNWIGQAVNLATNPLFVEENASRAEKSGERLQNIGLKLVNAVYHQEQLDLEGKVVKPARWGAATFVTGSPGFLAVSKDHQGLRKVFEGTKWNNGVWYQALKRNAHAIEGVTVKFGRAASRAVLVPLAAVLANDELPSMSKPEAIEAWLAEQIKGAGA